MMFMFNMKVKSVVVGSLCSMSVENGSGMVDWEWGHDLGVCLCIVPQPVVNGNGINRLTVGVV